MYKKRQIFIGSGLPDRPPVKHNIFLFAFRFWDRSRERHGLIKITRHHCELSFVLPVFSFWGSRDYFPAKANQDRRGQASQPQPKISHCCDSAKFLTFVLWKISFEFNHNVTSLVEKNKKKQSLRPEQSHLFVVCNEIFISAFAKKKITHFGSTP